MGALSSKGEVPTLDKDRRQSVNRDTTPLRDKELEATMNFYYETMRMKNLVANDGKLLRELTEPLAGGHAEAADLEPPFDTLEFPLDEDGFLQSFDVSEKQKISDFFHNFGFVAVSALNPVECTRSVDALWDFLERHNERLRRDDPNTWEKWPNLAKLGLLGDDVCLSPQLCENRQNPNVYAAFATVLGTERLWVNVSRASAMRPTRCLQMQRADGVVTEVDKPEWKSVAGDKWLHWDFNSFTGAATRYSWKIRDVRANRGFMGPPNLQGFIALDDCGPDDGGFFCVPGAHRYVRQWAHLNGGIYEGRLRKAVLSPEYGVQLHVPHEEDAEPLGLRKLAVRVPVRRGTLLIWDSRLPHSNFPNDSSHFRMVQYVTMVPVTNQCVEPLFTNQDLLPPEKDFQLTDLGARLYGFKPWVDE